MASAWSILVTKVVTRRLLSIALTSKDGKLPGRLLLKSTKARQSFRPAQAFRLMTLGISSLIWKRHTNMRTDQFNLEVIRNALEMIAEELTLTIIRTGYSNIVRDSLDFSIAICDKHG